MSEYLDGRLEPERERLLEEHLPGCPACRRELESLRQTVSLLREAPPVPAPADLPARVRERLERKPAPAFRWHIFSRPELRVALAAGVVLMVCVVGVVYERAGARRAAALPAPEAQPVAAPRAEAERAKSVSAARQPAQAAADAAREQAPAPAAAPTAPGAPAAAEDRTERKASAAVRRSVTKDKDRIWTSPRPAGGRLNTLSEGVAGAPPAPAARISRPAPRPATPLEETAANGLRLAARERAAGGAAAQSAVETVPAAAPAALRPDVSDTLGFDEEAGAIHLTLRGADKAAVLQALAGETVEQRESGQDARPTAKARAEPADRLRQAEASAAPSPAEVLQVYRSEEQEHIVARVPRSDLPKVMARLTELGAAAAEVEDQETTRAAPASAEEFVTLDILLVPGKKSTAHER